MASDFMDASEASQASRLQRLVETLVVLPLSDLPQTFLLESDIYDGAIDVTCYFLFPNLMLVLGRPVEAVVAAASAGS